jgi:exodeoxyribonuclease VII large subunit
MRSERADLHQRLREIRAASRRALVGRDEMLARFAVVLGRRRNAEIHEATRGSLRRRLASLEAAISAHDPDRVLERGYALVSDSKGEPVSSAAAARAARRIGVRFADDDVAAEVIDDD